MNVAAKPPETGGRLGILDLKAVISGELAQHGDWIVVSIADDAFWPSAPQKVRWRGADIWIIPVTNDFHSAIALRAPSGLHRAGCQELLLRFLSTLSWVEETGFAVEGGVSVGNLPRPLRRFKEHGFAIRDEFDLAYLPEVTDANAMRALALMREGRSLNHVGYAFLSFYRVIETAFPSASSRVAWMTDSIAELTGFGVDEALGSIRAQGITTPKDISLHLFRSGRCAMAHGAGEPIVDPDKLDDLWRLRSELPIVRALAVKAIEEVFGVETRNTVDRNHLYELAGFKKVLGPEIVRHMQNGTDPDGQQMQIPDINVRVLRSEPYAPLEGLRCIHASYAGKIIYLNFGSLRSDVEFRFGLDFGCERIAFDPFVDIRARDTGAATSADGIREVRRFLHDHFCNGHLYIFNAATGELLGRKDAYMPLNMYFDGRAATAELARWKALADERRDADQRFAEQMERNARGYDIKVQHG
jgi:hypothetical protein